MFLTGLGSMLVAIGGFMCLFRVCGRLWPRSCYQDGTGFSESFSQERTGSTSGIKARGSSSTDVSMCINPGILGSPHRNALQIPGLVRTRKPQTEEGVVFC